jgi:hemoglobin
MRDAHVHLVARGLNDEHFDAVIEHLGSTLMELGVPDNLVKQIADVALSVRDDVLNR